MGTPFKDPRGPKGTEVDVVTKGSIAGQEFDSVPKFSEISGLPVRILVQDLRPPARPAAVLSPDLGDSTETNGSVLAFLGTYPDTRA